MRTTIKTDGGTLQVDDSGVRGSDVALLFLHYWGGSSLTWRKVIALLDDKVRCIAVNQRGWGGSVATDSRYDLVAMADDTLSIVEQLGLKRVILVGHSMGGKVAQIFAARRPSQLVGMVLVAPSPPTPMPVPADVRQQMLQSYQSAAGVEQQALEMLAGPLLPLEDRTGVLSDTLAGMPEAKREWTEHGMVADLGITAGDIAVPTVMLVGSLDRVEAPERLRKIFGEVVPQARFNELAGVGHLAPLEAPEQIADACRELLITVTNGARC